ncbi:BspA family leucine-rich repeat surface protein [Planktomarina temperata]|nr:BspA family leucine-rich repeat surface protein [Planktomarina temperata]
MADGLKLNLKEAILLKNTEGTFYEVKGKNSSGANFSWQSPIVFTVDTSLGTSVELDRLNKEATTTCTVDWGDGTIQTATQGLVHTYASSSSVYDVKITGNGPFWVVVSSYDNVTKVKGYYGNRTDSMSGIRSTALTSIAKLPETITVMGVAFGIKPMNQSFIADVDTSNIVNMNSVFLLNSAFNQDLSGWNISKVTTMGNMLDDTAMSPENYSRTLISWANQHYAGNAQDNVNLTAYNITYNSTVYTTGNQFNDGASARAYLVSTAGWTISDGGQV